jgi:hypothetical protein
MIVLDDCSVAVSLFISLCSGMYGLLIFSKGKLGVLEGLVMFPLFDDQVVLFDS